MEMVDKLILSEEEWKKRLTPEEYYVLRQAGTERPWTGCFVGTSEPGTYVCRAAATRSFDPGRSLNRAPAGLRLLSPFRPTP